MADIIARLRELERAADLDPLESTHITSPGYTHLANLTEHIREGGKGGRGRCIAMTYKEWSDYIAAGMCALPVLLDALEALKKLTAEVGDHAIESVRNEWGNTNAAVLRHWRDSAREALARLEGKESA